MLQLLGNHHTIARRNEHDAALEISTICAQKRVVLLRCDLDKVIHSDLTNSRPCLDAVHHRGWRGRDGNAHILGVDLRDTVQRVAPREGEVVQFTALSPNQTRATARGVPRERHGGEHINLPRRARDVRRIVGLHDRPPVISAVVEDGEGV